MNKEKMFKPWMLPQKKARESNQLPELQRVVHYLAKDATVSVPLASEVCSTVKLDLW
jgi:hypothetical protein